MGIRKGSSRLKILEVLALIRNGSMRIGIPTFPVTPEMIRGFQAGQISGMLILTHSKLEIFL